MSVKDEYEWALAVQVPIPQGKAHLLAERCKPYTPAQVLAVCVQELIDGTLTFSPKQKDGGGDTDETHRERKLGQG